MLINPCNSFVITQNFYQERFVHFRLIHKPRASLEQALLSANLLELIASCPALSFACLNSHVSARMNINTFFVQLRSRHHYVRLFRTPQISRHTYAPVTRFFCNSQHRAGNPSHLRRSDLAAFCVRRNRETGTDCVNARGKSVFHRQNCRTGTLC